MDDNLPATPGRPATARLPIKDISHWVEHFSIMAAIIYTRFPEKAPELWAYQASIVHAERNYEATRWIAYDRQYRRVALARKDLNWSVADSRLYNETFTGRAKSIARCTYCIEDDHTEDNCSKNPNHPLLSWFPYPSTWPTPMPSTWPGLAHPTGPSFLGPSRPLSRDICRRFNEGRCRNLRCKYRHACSSCTGTHFLLTCPMKLANQAAGRSRSPPCPQQRGPPTAYQGQRY